MGDILHNVSVQGDQLQKTHISKITKKRY